MSDVFISYRNTPARRPFASRIALLLDSYGAKVWWDEGLEPGGDWARELRRRISAARVVVPLWCAESVKSEWVLQEARLGATRLTPARLQPIAPPPEFAGVHAVDLAGWRGRLEDASFQALASAVFNRLKQTPNIASYKRQELAGLPDLAPLDDGQSTRFDATKWLFTETKTGWTADVTLLADGKLAWKGRGPLDVIWAAGFWRLNGDRVKLELSPPVGPVKTYEGVVADNTRMQGPGWRAERA